MPKIAQLIAADNQRQAETLDEVRAARARVESDPLPRWEAAVASWEQKTAAGRANVADAEAAFDEASRAVAAGEEGSEARQNRTHAALVKSRHELEKASRALDHARRECALSRQAVEVCNRDDYRLASLERLREYQATARAAAEKLEGAIEAMRAADTELRDALGGVAAEWFPSYGETITEGSPIRDIPYALRVIYASALPVVWRPGEYDLFRSGFSPDRNVPTAGLWYECPSFSEAFSSYLMESK